MLTCSSMDITILLKRMLMSVQIGLLLAAVCIALPAIRVLEPEFEPVPRKVIHKKGDKARLFCSVRHLGERTVVWRRMSQKNPLTIGMDTWIDDPRIFVDHSESNKQWDLIIDGVNSGDAGEYECQISMAKKMLRNVIKLHVTESTSGQVKRNPEIIISGTQFVSSGDNISLFCNASILGNPRRVLLWFKGSQEVLEDGGRVLLSYVNSLNREQVSSNLRILNAQPDDSGLYTCRSRDEKLMTSAQVNVLTGGSNNVKRAGSTVGSQESGAVLSVQFAISHSTFMILVLLVHHLFT